VVELRSITMGGWHCAVLFGVIVILPPVFGLLVVGMGLAVTVCQMPVCGLMILVSILLLHLH